MTAQQTQMWAQRKATAMLIREEPTSIALQRKGTFQRTATGGQKRTGATVTHPARLRFFSAVDADDRKEYDIQGELVRADFVLVGMPDDTMHPLDEFMIGTRKFQIVFINPGREYECRAAVREVEASGLNS